MSDCTPFCQVGSLVVVKVTDGGWCEVLIVFRSTEDRVRACVDSLECGCEAEYLVVNQQGGGSANWGEFMRNWSF